VSWALGDSLVLAAGSFSPLILAFLPLAAAMVFADRIIARWADDNERIYSIRDLAILELVLVALLCLFFWFLRACGGQVRVMTAVWAFVAVAAFRAVLAFWANRAKAARQRRHVE